MILRIFHGLSAVVPLGQPGEGPGLPAESGEVVSCCGCYSQIGWWDRRGVEGAQICRRSPSVLGGTFDRYRYGGWRRDIVELPFVWC